MTKPETELVLVPREPTPEMIRAATNELVHFNTTKDVAIVLRAAIAAAPTLPLPTPAEEDLRVTDLQSASSPPAPSSTVPDVVREWNDRPHLNQRLDNDLAKTILRWEVLGDHMAEVFTAQAAEVERLRGCVADLETSVMMYEGNRKSTDALLIQTTADLRTAESSLETARGALESLAAEFDQTAQESFESRDASSDIKARSRFEARGNAYHAAADALRGKIAKALPQEGKTQ